MGDNICRQPMRREERGHVETGSGPGGPGGGGGGGEERTEGGCAAVSKRSCHCKGQFF